MRSFGLVFAAPFRALDFADLRAKRAVPGKTAYRQRVRNVLRGAKTQKQAAACVKGLRKVCDEVWLKKGAAARCKFSLGRPLQFRGADVALVVQRSHQITTHAACDRGCADVSLEYHGSPPISKRHEGTVRQADLRPHAGTTGAATVRRCRREFWLSSRKALEMLLEDFTNGVGEVLVPHRIAEGVAKKDNLAAGLVNLQDDVLLDEAMGAAPVEPPRGLS